VSAGDFTTDGGNQFAVYRNIGNTARGASAINDRTVTDYQIVHELSPGDSG